MKTATQYTGLPGCGWKERSSGVLNTNKKKKKQSSMTTVIITCNRFENNIVFPVSSAVAVRTRTHINVDGGQKDVS